MGETCEFGAGDVGHAAQEEEKMGVDEGGERPGPAFARMGEVADSDGSICLELDVEVATVLGECLLLLDSVQYATARCVVRADIDDRGGVVEADEDRVARMREERAVGSGERCPVGKLRPDGWVCCYAGERGDGGEL